MTDHHYTRNVSSCERVKSLERRISLTISLSKLLPLLKVTQNYSQKLDLMGMLQSWYQKTVQSSVNMLSTIFMTC